MASKKNEEKKVPRRPSVGAKAPKKESIFGVPYRKNIPPVCTVRDLKGLLAELPDSLPLAIYDNGYRPVWYNVGSGTEHLSLEANDGTMEDA